jgi:glycerophosphoryl diester phosphodiesterase
MKIIGHRGDRKYFDDNTIEGFESAFSKGADGVEFDVHYKPGYGVYVNHKFLYDPNRKYPFFEDVVRLFKDSGKLQIEIKTPRLDAVNEVCKIIKETNLSNFEITSSVLPLLSHVRKQVPHAVIGMIIKPYLIEDWMSEDFRDELMMGYFELTGANSIWLDKPENFWNKVRVNKYHSMGYKVNSHLCDDNEKIYNELSGMDIDSCTADDLQVVRFKK